MQRNTPQNLLQAQQKMATKITIETRIFPSHKCLEPWNILCIRSVCPAAGVPPAKRENAKTPALNTWKHENAKTRQRQTVFSFSGFLVSVPAPFWPGRVFYVLGKHPTLCIFRLSGAHATDAPEASLANPMAGAISPCGKWWNFWSSRSGWEPLGTGSLSFQKWGSDGFASNALEQVETKIIFHPKWWLNGDLLMVIPATKNDQRIQGECIMKNELHTLFNWCLFLAYSVVTNFKKWKGCLRILKTFA